MKRPAALALLLTTLTLAGCGASASPGEQAGRQAAVAPSGWRIGFWAWETSWDASFGSVPEPMPVDDLYIQGIVVTRAGDRARWPEQLPAARRYWVTWRFELNQRPSLEDTPPESLALRHATLLAEPRTRGLDVAGVQIDFDCPTGRLGDYATWLGRLRKSLPPGANVSITALLDWFRPGTAISDVVAQVDEFVPQFYDARPPARSAMTIAEPVDAGRWAPIFNRFKKPYRIGISSFGRVRVGGSFALGPSLLQILSAPALGPVSAAATPARERRLTLEARAATTIEWTRIEAGSVVEILIPTTDSVSAAYAGAKAMGGFCAGVIFFRWPADNETAVLVPAQVLRAIGALPAGTRRDEVEAQDADCAAVTCSDLFVRPGDQFPEAARVLAVKASNDLEYFLPQPKVARLASMTARDTISVRLPAYHGETRLYLGRAVSKSAPRFSIGGASR